MYTTALIRAGHDRLAGGAGEPVNHRAAHDEAEDDFRLHDAQRIDDGFERTRNPRGHLALIHALQQHDDSEHHRGGADDRGADKHRLGRGFEGVACAVALFELILGIFEVRVESKIPLDLFLDAFSCLDLAEFIDRLRVVRDRTVAVHRDGHGAHAEEAERHEAERKDRRGEEKFLRHQ
jgi:hypothetical protein